MNNHIRSILFLAFPNAGEQDLLAPWELFRSVAWSLGARGEKLEVTLGSLEGGVVTTQMGAKIEMDRKIEPTDRYDLVYVPGGIGAGQLSQNAEALELLRAHHREGRWVAANCAGVGVLHRAGILAGASVTSPATLARGLPAQGTPIANPRRAWLVDSGRKIFTSGGAATVHPGTIALVTELFGEQQGRELAAGWDTLPLHGEALFSKLGPEMHDDAAIATGLQDQWENVFLPPVASSPLTTRPETKAMKTIAIALASLLVSSVAAGQSRASFDQSLHGSDFGAPTPRDQAREQTPDDESGELRPGGRILGTADVAARVGPVGAAVRVGLILHHTYEVDASRDHENSYLEGGLTVTATPATLEPHAHLEYLPVPFLVLRGEFAAVRYLGSNYGLLSFDSKDADFSNEALSARKGDEQQAWGMRAGLSVTPRIKLGPVLLRSKLSITAYHFNHPGPYVYEADLDTLLGTTDFVLSSRSEVLFELHDGPGAETLLLGPTVETRRTIDSALSRTRVGAALWYVPTERWGNLHQPRLYAQAGINAVDPNRRGEFFSAVGFGADYF